jgi:SAM-dependent methyltransferase
MIAADLSPEAASHPKYYEEVNLALSEAIGRPRTVLDVGCGRGQNGAIARARGARVVGLECFPESAAVARGRLDEVFAVDIEAANASAPLKDRRFDLILFGDVLEHTRDPLAVMNRFLPFLEDGGHVIVSLPNVAAWTVRLSLLAGRFEYQQSGILDETHLRFFTLATALKLVEDAGLEVLARGMNPMLVRAGLGMVRSMIQRGGNQGGADQGEAIAKHPAYAAYLRFVRPAESIVASLMPNLLAFQHIIVARKPPQPRRLSFTVGMISMNEAGAVGDVIDQIRRDVPEAEILLVDSSKDETPQIAEAKGARVIRQVPPKGYGPAMHRLLYSAETDVIVTLDCDGTYPTDCIRQLVRLVEDGSDVVNGTRTHQRPKAMPFANFLANRVFAGAATLLHGLDTSDLHSGMRAYRTSMLRGIEFDPVGPALPVDLLVLPARLGYKVVDVPIAYHERIGASTLQRFDSTLWTFKRLTRSLSKGRRV